MCSALYGLAIADPFNPKATGVCLPTFPSIKSQKVRRFLRLTFVVGTAGCGFITMAPSLANDSYAICTTTAAYTQTGVELFNGAAGSAAGAAIFQTGVSPAYLPGPWSTANLLAANDGVDADVSNSVQGRIVQAAMRVQYAGSLLNRGGIYTALAEPDHLPLFSNAVVTDATLGGNVEAYVMPNDGQRVQVNMLGVYPDELAYTPPTPISAFTAGFPSIFPMSPGAQQWNTGAVLAADHNMVIMVTGGVAGTIYQCEVVVHCEYIGRPTAGVSTPSESDVLGFQAVNAAGQTLAERIGHMGKNAVDHATTVLNTLVAGQQASSSIATSISKIAGAYMEVSGRRSRKQRPSLM
jgi:hypothetical protein